VDGAQSSRTYDPARIHPRQNIPSADEPAARRDLAKLYGMYSAVDDLVGRQLAEIDRKGAAQDTIVVFTSDSGQQAGSQGLDGDDVAFEESVRVPLAIRYPRALPQGTVSDLLVSHVDIMPTLLGLCGAPPPEGVQGHDLSELLSGRKGERPESVYAEGKIGQKDEWRTLVLGSDKIVVNGQAQPTHIYNLADDPYEMKNLVHEPAIQLKRDQLLAFFRESMRRLGDFKTRV
jgi:arylsulfatase A-like enzyme